MTKEHPMCVLPESYLELNARERAMRLVDPGTFRVLAGPFSGISSTWLRRQGIVPQADDGVVIAQGTMGGQKAVLVSIEGGFQGGSIGEVSGSKILAALRLTRGDCEQGNPRVPILLLETGGVRLQEANLGLELLSEIHAEIVVLRRYVPVIAVIAGSVGCFGGMSIAAALCSYLLMTTQGRYALNGPEVIEQEAGAEELQASDRQTVWALTGGAQRVLTGFADELIVDDMQVLRDRLLAFIARGRPAAHRSERVEHYLALLESKAASEVWEPEDVRRMLPHEGAIR